AHSRGVECRVAVPDSLPVTAPCSRSYAASTALSRTCFEWNRGPWGQSARGPGNRGTPWRALAGGPGQGSDRGVARAPGGGFVPDFGRGGVASARERVPVLSARGVA